MDNCDLCLLVLVLLSIFDLLSSQLISSGTIPLTARTLLSGSFLGSGGSFVRRNLFLWLNLTVANVTLSRHICILKKISLLEAWQLSYDCCLLKTSSLRRSCLLWVLHHWWWMLLTVPTRAWSWLRPRLRLSWIALTSFLYEQADLGFSFRWVNLSCMVEAHSLEEFSNFLLDYLSCTLLG